MLVYRRKGAGPNSINNSMKFTLLEHYLTLISPDQKDKYKNIVWDILQKSYKNIGGFWTHKDPDELIKFTSLWKLNRKRGEIVAVAVYRDRMGRKCVGMGSNGTLPGIEALMGIMKEDQDPKLRRAWIEISPRLEKIWKKIGGKQLNSNLANLILQTNVTPMDEYHYERKIADREPQVKSIWGFPKVPELSLENVKFKIISAGSNANYDYRKYKRKKSPKTQKSIPDKDLEMQKGKSYKQALKAGNEYYYRGKPYGATEPHV